MPPSNPSCCLIVARGCNGETRSFSGQNRRCSLSIYILASGNLSFILPYGYASFSKFSWFQLKVAHTLVCVSGDWNRTGSRPNVTVELRFWGRPSLGQVGRSSEKYYAICGSLVWRIQQWSPWRDIQGGEGVLRKDKSRRAQRAENVCIGIVP